MASSIPASLRSPGRHWIRVGTLLNGLDAPVLDAHLVFDGETILHAAEEEPPVSLRRDGQIEPDASLPEHVALPGLIESHAHLFLEGGERDPARRAEYLKQSDAD